MTGQFFSVSAERFSEACDLGIGHAISYLVLACGTGRDHATTAWSGKAIGKYAGINPVRARRFIGELEEAGLLARHGSTQKPRYMLTTGDSPIWLPNSVVTHHPRSPAFLLRQTRDVGLLKTFVQLYDVQNLGFDGGIHPEILSHDYHADDLGAVGACRVYAVSPEGTVRTNPEWPGAEFMHESDWRPMFHQLRRLGLLVESVQVFDDAVTELHAAGESPEGEFLYCLDGPTDEESLHEYFVGYLEGIESAWHESMVEGKNHDGQYLAMVPLHIEEPRFIGIFRLRHIARTKAHTTWWARIMDARRDMANVLGG